MTLKDSMNNDLDNVFFKNDSEFNTQAVFTALCIGAPPKEIYGIFEKEFEDPGGSFEVPEGGTQPVFTCKSSDVEYAQHGDSLFIESNSYKVLRSQPDGTGLTVLVLEKL